MTSSDINESSDINVACLLKMKKDGSKKSEGVSNKGLSIPSRLSDNVDVPKEYNGFHICTEFL